MLRFTRGNRKQLAKTRRETRLWLKQFENELVESVVRRRDSVEGDPELSNLIVAIRNADER